MQICFPHWTSSRLKPWLHTTLLDPLSPNPKYWKPVLVYQNKCLPALAFPSSNHSVVFVLLPDHKPFVFQVPNFCESNNFSQSGFCTSARSQAFCFPGSSFSTTQPMLSKNPVFRTHHCRARHGHLRHWRQALFLRQEVLTSAAAKNVPLPSTGESYLGGVVTTVSTNYSRSSCVPPNMYVWCS